MRSAGCASGSICTICGSGSGRTCTGSSARSPAGWAWTRPAADPARAARRGEKAAPVRVRSGGGGRVRRRSPPPRIGPPRSATRRAGDIRAAEPASRRCDAAGQGIARGVGRRRASAHRAAGRAALAHRAETRTRPGVPGHQGHHVRHLAGVGAGQAPPRFVMAAELVETSRLWGRLVARIDPAWAEKVGATPGAPQPFRTAVGGQARVGGGHRAGHPARRHAGGRAHRPVRPDRSGTVPRPVHPQGAGRAGLGEPAPLPGRQRRHHLRRSRSGRTGSAAGIWSSTTRRCTPCTTRGSRPTSPRPVRSTPGGSGSPGHARPVDVHRGRTDRGRSRRGLDRVLPGPVHLRRRRSRPGLRVRPGPAGRRGHGDHPAGRVGPGGPGDLRGADSRPARGSRGRHCCARCPSRCGATSCRPRTSPAPPWPGWGTGRPATCPPNSPPS